MYDSTERKRAIEKIETPKTWPNWPSLPMKRKVTRLHFEQSEFGEITPDHPLVIFVAPFSQRLSVTAIGKLAVSEPGSGGIWDEIVHHVYMDFDAMFDDGWMVD